MALLIPQCISYCGIMPGVYRGTMRNTLMMRSKCKSTSTSPSDKTGSAGMMGVDMGGRTRSLSPLYSPRTPNQELYVKYLNDPNVSILLGVGPAGTGKTLFACNAAVQELKRGSVQKIIVTRPMVSVEEEIGFLPGNLISKMDPWTRPIFDIFGEYYARKDLDAMLASGVVEISPLAFMRGRTFKRAFIIADEMQNSSPNQMLMLATRLGQGSKMVITGDLKQSDRALDNNGLADLMQKLIAYESRSRARARAWAQSDLEDADADRDREDMMIRLVQLDLDDVQRNIAVSKILEIYGDKGFTNVAAKKKTPPPPPTGPVLETSVVPKKPYSTSTSSPPVLDNDAALMPFNHYTGKIH